MGQRHQVYVAFKDYSGDWVNTPKVTIIGIHHQWLYGRNAATQANRMMQLVENNRSIKSYAMDGYCNPFYTKERAMETLKAIYSMIPELGYFHDVYPLENGECENPLLGDNNEGITIFDFTDFSSPKYCMMGINERPFEIEVFKNSDPVRLFPYASWEYAQFYYPENPNAYWIQNAKNKRQINQVRAEIRKIDKTAKKFKLLTVQRVKELFPAMFAKQTAEVH